MHPSPCNGGFTPQICFLTCFGLCPFFSSSLTEAEGFPTASAKSSRGLSVLSMLLVHAGIAEHDVVAAVSRRFTSSEITAALAFLQQQGLVNSSGVKRPLMLSKLFAEHMEVMRFWLVHGEL